MNTKLCSLKYTPNAFIYAAAYLSATSAIEIIAFMPDTITEPMLCMMIAGKPTAYMFLSVSFFKLKPLKLIFISCFFLKRIISTKVIEQN